MGDFTQKMGLATWDQQLDRYDYLQLSNNWQILDFHDHTPGRGVPIGAGGIGAGVVTSNMLNAALSQAVGINTTGQTVKGVCVNAGPGSRTNTLYGALNDAPDQVPGIVLPTNGLIRVWYQATWQESFAGAARASIFLGANQNTVAAVASRSDNEAGIGGSNTSVNVPLASFPGGLFSPPTISATNYPGDVTTGQIVGAQICGTGTAGISGSSLPPQSVGNSAAGGPCYLFAAAGTYTVSVQFNATSGHSVTASNRKLWVEAVSFT